MFLSTLFDDGFEIEVDIDGKFVDKEDNRDVTNSFLSLLIPLSFCAIMEALFVACKKLVSKFSACICFPLWSHKNFRTGNPCIMSQEIAVAFPTSTLWRVGDTCKDSGAKNQN